MFNPVEEFKSRYGVPKGLEWIDTVEYVVVQSVGELEDFLTSNDFDLFVRVGMDTETTSLDVRSCELVGISLAPTEGVACYIPLAHVGYQDNLPVDEVKRLLTAYLQGRKAVFYNAKFDLLVLKYKGFPRYDFEDAMVAVYLADVSDKSFTAGLKAVAPKVLGVDMIAFEEILGTSDMPDEDGGSFAHTNPLISGLYAAADADMALRVRNKLESVVNDEEGKPTFIWRLENAVISVLVDMEENTIPMSTERLEQQIRDAWNDTQVLTQMIYRSVGKEFNINSPDQVIEVITKDLGVKPKRLTKGGKISTSKYALEELADEHPVISWIEAVRILQKNVLQGYCVKLLHYAQEQGAEARFNFNSVLAPSGRLSSDSGGAGAGCAPINAQNIPSSDSFVRFTARRVLNKEEFLEHFGIPEEDPPLETLLEHVRTVNKKRARQKKARPARSAKLFA